MMGPELEAWLAKNRAALLMAHLPWWCHADVEEPPEEATPLDAARPEDCGEQT
jgi:hypothetical protein